MNKFIRLVSCIGLTFLAGFIGSIFTTPAIPTWYAFLNKPEFSPPNWVFAPVWTTLYILMGVSIFLVLEHQGKVKDKRHAYFLYILQLAFNAFWSYAFFGLRNPIFGLVVIVHLWYLIVLTIEAFKHISRPAAWLLTPYALWVSFATVLNVWIVVMN